MRIRWTVPAADDLESIKNYLQQHYPHFAETTIRTIYRRIRSLKTLNILVDPASNRISSSGFGYDANGNLNALTGTYLNYDVENRLVRADGPGYVEQYAYAPDNKRVWKKLPDGTQDVWFYGVDGRKLGTYSPVNTGGVLSFNTADTNVNFGDKLIRSRGSAVAIDRLETTRWANLAQPQGATSSG